MRTYAVGKMVGDQTIYMPKEILTESVIGQVYELQIKTRGVPDPRNTTIVLQKKLKEKFNATLLYFEVDDNVITMQIEGSPFAWSLLLVFLPEILVGLGIVVLFIMVYLVTSAIPSWKYGLTILALILIFLGPGAVSKVVMMREAKR